MGFLKLFRKDRQRRRRLDYYADGLGLRGKSLAAIEEPGFRKAFDTAVELNREGWGGKVPDIRWRAHTAVWAARHGLALEGDFVECGVYLGLLSLTIAHSLDFARVPKRFWLFDTWDGLAEGALTDQEKQRSDQAGWIYRGVYELAARNFAPFPNVTLVRGTLPQSLEGQPIGKIAYLSMDLNSAAPEEAVIRTLWDRITPGGVVLLDDYGWTGFDDQRRMWDGFAAGRGVPILSLPTGQGLILKPPA
ncbi:Methyltransferase,-like protein [Polymorphum gilvum SL003B-26A1]|uniref:Methyltransferase,-like protein n=1 Tax=Polymorphum gilvum (strain LMG 25793 / CGMCC 1.9160 / SL003B-26A1) TaxID=991905 RepID=F2IVG5_POLGS|nr:Methyltransferase,-like protein [Polymorphum gilvum SL003B-26A1]